MTISLEIAPELENQLRQTAAKNGTTLESYLTELIQRDLKSCEEIGINLPKTEAELLAQINLGLSEEMWQKYHLLLDKRRSEILEPNEQQELIEISDRIERANAKRIAALAKLSQIRGVEIGILMEEFGIKTPSYE
ncbi:hypothetical protein [Spirulina sp. 06S082]|uniref:hypothetical protein n=1 Tax=Spirulina sp. 06S082 TaxID=3110248 RepID=UPI002B2001A6|nr:hypothetical protein [Spirulina sp. 06S082]MEA5467722.1 hypothetical protein [Spirulina sp. 06S082]